MAMQKVTGTRGAPLFQEKGWEGVREIYRFDTKLSILDTLQTINLAYYIEYVDSFGNRHEYKLLGFDSRNVLGCIWVTLYGENITARDIKNSLHDRVKVKAIP